MSDIDMDGAMNALSQELPEESGVEENFDHDIVEDNQETESFTGFDPSTLPEDLQVVYKSMQADYTRKTQEVAEIRRQAEAFSEVGVDPNDALVAVQFLQRLQGDPNFASQFARDLQEELEQGTGYENTYEDNAPDNVGYENIPDALAYEIAELQQFKEEYMMQQQYNETLAELEAQEQHIRVANPHWSDDDLEAVYSLAYATDGDLIEAANQYNTIQQRLLGNYLQAKQAPAGATPMPSGPSTTPGESFKNLDDAHKAALERIRNIS